jgi:hypothetical protein
MTGGAALLFGQKFEGDEAVESRVLGLVNHTHPTAQFLQNAVMRNGLSDKRLGFRHVGAILGREPEGVKGRQRPKRP